MMTAMARYQDAGDMISQCQSIQLEEPSWKGTVCMASLAILKWFGDPFV